jgi:hypothetical protein
METGWKLFQGGDNQSQSYSKKADNLFQATEILRNISNIPDLTYYIVETPDGNLGRDMNGFFTEGPLNTKNLIVRERQNNLRSFKCAGLFGFGNMRQNHLAVAQIIQTGNHAKLVLLMRCGNCNYESPVETHAGSFIRECFKCGSTNNCERGDILVNIDGGTFHI